MAITEIRDYDDEARIVTIHTGPDTISRAYDAEENVAADARTTIQTNEKTLNTDTEGAIASLTTSIATLKAIADKTNATIGPADTKAVAKELRQVTRQVVRLTRLFTKQFDSADVGAE